MATFSVSFARRRLLRVALIGGGIIFMILLAQTIGNKHGETVGVLWIRYLVLWLPLLLAMIGVMWYPAPGHRADRPLFLTARILLWLYFVAHLAVFLLEPMSSRPLIEMIRPASFGFLPVEVIIIVITLLLVFKPADSAAETLDELPDSERAVIRTAFTPVAEQARRMIRQDRLPEAFKVLVDFCEEKVLPHDDLFLLQRRLKENEDKYQRGVLTQEEYGVSKARIAESLLAEIEQIGQVVAH